MTSAFKSKTQHAMRNDLFNNKSRHVDTRPYLQRFLSFLPRVFHIVFYCSAALTLISPTYTYFIVLIFAVFALFAVGTQLDYMISVPTFSKGNGFFPEDGLNESVSLKLKKEGIGLELRGKPKKNNSRAYLLMGYDLLFGRQMWIDLDRETRMTLIAGTTGSGKTVTQNAQLFQTCIQGHLQCGAPLLLFDGKGSIAGLYDFIFYIIRTGRIHDLRILNFLTGGITQDPSAMLDDDYSSNKFNPFSILNKEESRGLVMSFAGSSEGGNSDFFRNRASTMLAGIFSPLTYKRDVLGEPLDASVIRKFTELRNMFRLSADDSIPLDVRKPLREYLKTLNGVEDAHFELDVDRGFTIDPKAEEQHTYNRSMLSKTLNEMTESLGHIFCSTGSDINLRHAIDHGQIVIVLLPTIEKETSAMQELGRMMVGALRPAFAPLLGFKVQGTREAVVDALSSNRVVPVRISLDEVLNYYTQGISNFLSLMRSSQVAMTLLGQSLKGIYDQGESEGRQSLANLNNKLMFSTQDVYETMEVIEKSVGNITTTQQQQIQSNYAFGWRNADTLQVQEQSAVDARDMASADPMEGLYLFRGNVIPFKSATFFPDDERDGIVDQFRLNIFAELMNPTQDEVDRIRAISSVAADLRDGEVKPIDQTKHQNELIESFCSNLNTKLVAAKRLGTQYTNLMHIMTYALADELMQDSNEEYEKQREKMKEQADLKHRTGQTDVDVSHVISENSGDMSLTAPTAEMFQDEFAEYINMPEPYQENDEFDITNDDYVPPEDAPTSDSLDHSPQGLLTRAAKGLGVAEGAISVFPIVEDDEDEESTDTGTADDYSATDDLPVGDGVTKSNGASEASVDLGLAGLLLTGDELANSVRTNIPFGRVAPDEQDNTDESNQSDEQSESFNDLFSDEPQQDSSQFTSASEREKDSNTGGSNSYLTRVASSVIDDVFSTGEAVTGESFSNLKDEIIAPPSYPTLPELTKLTSNEQQTFVNKVSSTLSTTESTLADDLVDGMFN